MEVVLAKSGMLKIPVKLSTNFEIMKFKFGLDNVKRNIKFVKMDAFNRVFKRKKN
jgi:hypothetical protein